MHAIKNTSVLQGSGMYTLTPQTEGVAEKNEIANSNENNQAQKDGTITIFGRPVKVSTIKSCAFISCALLTIGATLTLIATLCRNKSISAENLGNSTYLNNTPTDNGTWW